MNSNMKITSQIAKHIRDVHFGGNWTVSNLRDQLKDVDWKMATRNAGDLNTIAALVYHINYYIGAILPVLSGGPLNASDKFSFALPPIESEADWNRLLDKVWQDAENFAAAVEQLPDDILGKDFVDGKYGNYWRNFIGIIEHTHYHLGQIVVIRKMLLH
jgi:hypothetical protein